MGYKINGKLENWVKILYHTRPRIMNILARNQLQTFITLKGANNSCYLC